jgi:hypothetical protein
MNWMFHTVFSRAILGHYLPLVQMVLTMVVLFFPCIFSEGIPWDTSVFSSNTGIVQMNYHPPPF